VSAARKNVLVFRELPPDQLARLQAEHEVTMADPRIAAQSAAFEAALPMAQGLIGSSFRIDAALLARAPRLEVISSISVGVDNYDLPALRARGIVLCHTPGVLTETTADTVFALIMASSRRLVELASLVREGRWNRNLGEDLFGWDVHGKTLGILGFGRIGQALARRAALGFGMPVLYHSRRPVAVPDLAGHATHTPLDQLLARADIVAAVLPLTDETRGLMGPREFGLMKPDGGCDKAPACRSQARRDRAGGCAARRTGPWPPARCRPRRLRHRAVAAGLAAASAPEGDLPAARRLGNP
jgi:phosphogluconate 2-dehydrogenase